MTKRMLTLGTRVRIATSHHWAQGATGTIATPPDFARELVKDQHPWCGWRRYVKGASQMIEFYWIWFDKPQKDADGDGPYRGGEIEAGALEPL